MSNGETNTRDTRVVGAYRVASEVLDEQPQAGTRAAILAAAARAVQAQPQDAETGAISRRPAHRMRERMSAIGPSKRPLALVASFLVATVALVLATQTDEQRGVNAPESGVAKTTVPTTAESRSADVALQAKSPGADADVEAKREASGPTTSLAMSGAATDKIVETARQAPPQTAAKRTQPAAPAAMAPPAPAPSPPAPAVSPREPVPERAATRSERALADTNENAAVQGRRDATGYAAAPPSAAAAAAPPVAQAEERAKENANRQESTNARTAQRAIAETDVSSAGKLAKAKPVERTVAIAENVIEADPARWIQRIIALRDAGYDDDADRELVRLRERYPDHKVPPEALRRTGTR